MVIIKTGLFRENEDLKKASQEANKSLVVKENQMLKDELSVLQAENKTLKDMIRKVETESPSLLANEVKDDNLSKLTKEFLDELSLLEKKASDGCLTSSSTTLNGNVQTHL